MNRSISALANADGVIPTSGQGRGKGLGNGPRRYVRVYRDNIHGITKASIRRMARRGGVKRMTETAAVEARGALRDWLMEVLRFAIRYTEHARRKTVTTMDIVLGVKRMGTKGSTLYV